MAHWRAQPLTWMEAGGCPMCTGCHDPTAAQCPKCGRRNPDVRQIDTPTGPVSRRHMGKPRRQWCTRCRSGHLMSLPHDDAWTGPRTVRTTRRVGS